MTNETLLTAAVAIPTLGALLVALCGRWPNLRETVTLVTAVILFGVVITLLPDVLNGARPASEVFELMPGLPIAFSLEPLGMLFALIASGLWIVSSVYSIGYMRANDEHKQTRFYVCFALAIAGAMGVALSANLFTLFVFYEVLTLCTYPLVTHHGDEAARRGGRIYLGILLFTSIGLLLPAIIATYFIAGTMDFTAGGILNGKLSATGLTVLMLMFMFGVGKAALMPFHLWLPSAMVAPTPVSALLHAVAVVKAGVFSIVKIIVYVFGLEAAAIGGWWLIYVAGFTVIVASIIAMRADNLKRRLAYSTVSQLSYVVIAAAIFTPLSIVAAALHIAAHAVSKITLFFAAGAIYTAAHKTEISQMDGLGRRMPWTFAAFGIAALSMIGLPPTAGMVSKWYLATGIMQTQHWFALAVIFISTLLNAAYFLPIVYRGFFRPLPTGSAAHGEAPRTMVGALVVTAALTILMFFFSDIPMTLARALAGIGAS